MGAQGEVPFLFTVEVYSVWCASVGVGGKIECGCGDPSVRGVQVCTPRATPT